MAVLATIIHLEETLMAQQDQINADVQVIGDALTTIANQLQAERDQLASAHPDADLSGLDAVAQKAKDLASSATPAASATPADSSAPADTTPTDTGTPAANDPSAVNPAPTL